MVSSSKHKWGLCATVAAILGGIVFFYFIDPGQCHFVPKCPFKLLTGFSCPSCGFQRALHAALHGNWFTAIHYNWFLLVALPYAVTLVLGHGYQKSVRIKRWIHFLENRYFIYIYIALFFIWWVVRNLMNW